MSSVCSVSSWKYCCDPFKLHRKLVFRGLQRITKEMAANHASLSLRVGQKVCTNCRQQLRKHYSELPQSSEGSCVAESEEVVQSVGGGAESGTVIQSVEGSRCVVESDEAMQLVGDLRTSSEFSDDATSSEQNEDAYEDEDYILTALNDMLTSAGGSPISKRKARNKKYLGEKITQVKGAIKNVFLKGDDHLQHYKECEVIQQLKEKFATTSARSEKVKILTVLPYSWSLSMIEKEFSVSDYMARQAKRLVAEKGILSGPNLRLGTTILSEETLNDVVLFYCSDDVSRQMPGKKDFVSVTTSQGREHVQKRLLLSNLKEAYQQFKTLHPNTDIGFSKFADLRPKQCVLAGSSGTHSVCVCVTHQNVKLMFIGCNLKSLSNGEIPDYKTCLEVMRCNPARAECFLGECNGCPGSEKLRETIMNIMDANLIDAIEFKQWTTTDRANLETKVLSVDEFVDCFIESVEKLQVHDFIAKMQSRFASKTKESLQPGEYLVVADFSENYSAVIQDEIQSYHWNSTQTTIHPFVCYYKLR